MSRSRSVSQPRAARHGFALVTVLWLIVGATALTTAALMGLRSTIAAARNRSNLTIAEWRAEDCLERTRAGVSDVLVSAVSSGPPNTAAWRNLDQVIDGSPYVAGLPCTVVLTPAGLTLDINAAERENLEQLFAFLGLGELARDSLADALLDWRDADESPRARGVEREWYKANARLEPRNAPLPNVAELRQVRGFERVTGLDSLLGVERGRIVLDRAPLAVIASLPGMTDEAVLRIAERRARGLEVGEVASIAAELSVAARRALESRFSELAQRVTTEPDAWVIRVTTHAGEPPVTSELEARLVRAGTRAAVIRRRRWP